MESFEVDFSLELQGVARFRVNVFNQQRGAAAVFRVIPLRVPTLDALETPRVFKDIVSVSRGLVLVTGPTGSGKSTTLAAMIDHLNDRLYAHILTIEDPTEFVHTGRKCLINQRESAGIPWISVRPCVRPCGRTWISSWWARCGTWRPSG